MYESPGNSYVYLPIIIKVDYSCRFNSFNTCDAAPFPPMQAISLSDWQIAPQAMPLFILAV